ncbi:hypothetical protein UFOVP747_3 [uncultured Caudovirales phage]|uniref:Uncharacterized protein n=1 Tax=uncultured Caudovirales phage TaxID=2100421 RepID=A0A6J5ND30_9CAUD|nr:hypothetical protein UFOVP675_27 [uncultured Caudovirales phage]CAB5225296.1 hypothetical protein UFOVP747_3 [uncultured Caudovirales phage]
MAGKGGRTAGTRPKGSGIPAGGTGHGPGKPPAAFSSEYQPPAEAKKAGHEIGAEIRAAIASKRWDILNAQMSRALDPEHPQGHQASKDLLDRIMPPESRVEQDVAITVATGVVRGDDA